MRIVVQLILVALFLGGGASGAYWLVKTRRTPPKRPPVIVPDVVRVEVVHLEHKQPVVAALGTVEAARQITLVPQVTGKVSELSAAFVAGGRFGRDDVMVRIDPRDYTLALEKAQADLEKARSEVRLEEGRRQVAEREWSLFSNSAGAPAESRELALREPQKRQAEAALQTASSALELAELNLGRTVLRAPFNLLVLEETVDVGQLVSPASRLATLVGTDAFWVRVAVPLDQLGWLDVPGENGTAGAAAQVIQDLGPRQARRSGRVIRLLGDVESAGRLARLIVEIPDPLGGEDDPLLLGSCVRVELAGRARQSVAEIPASALHEGDRVQLLTAESKLEIRPVQIAWRGERTVFVGSGLAEGDQLIVSRLPAPVPGMTLRRETAAAETK